MQEETKNWLLFSNENLEAAKILLESQLYNSCLHNVQQSIEKSLKSIFIEKGIPFKKTHNIMELRNILIRNNVFINISEDECDFIDSIYLPTKYPIVSALPFFEPNEDICINLIDLAKKVLEDVQNYFK